jgi:hypothetical protein
MKYAAFSLAKEPGKTRVGTISADGKTVQELDLGADVSEDGIVAILRADLAGKTPSSIATHAFSDIRLLAQYQGRAAISFVLVKTTMSMQKSFLIAALMAAPNQAKIFLVTLSSLPSHQNLSLAQIPV